MNHTSIPSDRASPVTRCAGVNAGLVRQDALPLGQAVEAVLRNLRDHGRRAIRILDLDCRSGARAIRIARRARALGFLSIEVRGCARSDQAIRIARRASAAQADPAIGWQFDRASVPAAIATEEDGADLVLISRAALHAHDADSRVLRQSLLAIVADTLVVVGASRVSGEGGDTPSLRPRRRRALVLTATARRPIRVAA